MSWFEKISMMITAIGFYNCARFVWTYQRRSRGQWKQTPHGRYMMFTALVLGSLFALILANRLFPGGFPGREFIIVTLYIIYVAFTGWLNKILNLSLSEPRASEEVA